MNETNLQLKSAVESIIFISERPITPNEIQGVLEGIDLQTIRAIIDELRNDYEQRNSGIKIVEVAEGFQMVTSPNVATFVKKFYKIKHTEKLSMPSLETLSIIAYKQPITKVEIEVIRGVNVDGVIKNILDKGLVRIVGRKEVVGRPFVYGTTRSFLEYFGLSSLQELPPIEDFVAALSDKDNTGITPLEEGELENLSEKPIDKTTNTEEKGIQNAN